MIEVEFNLINNCGSRIRVDYKELDGEQGSFTISSGRLRLALKAEPDMKYRNSSFGKQVNVCK